MTAGLTLVLVMCEILSKMTFHSSRDLAYMNSTVLYMLVLRQSKWCWAKAKSRQPSVRQPAVRIRVRVKVRFRFRVRFRVRDRVRVRVRG